MAGTMDRKASDPAPVLSTGFRDDASKLYLGR